MAESMQSTFWFYLCTWSGRKNDAARAHGQTDNARFNSANSNCLRLLIAAAGCNRRAFLQSGLQRCLVSDRSCELGAFMRFGQPITLNPQGIQYLRRPIALLEVEQNCSRPIAFIHAKLTRQAIADVILR